MTHCNFLHIRIWSVQKSFFFCNGNTRKSIGISTSTNRSSFEGIERHIDLGTRLPAAYFFSDIEHRSFIALPFSNDDRPIKIKGIEGGAQGVYGSPIAGFFFPPPPYTRGSHGRCLFSPN